MMNPTTLTFERDLNSDCDNCVYCKMIIRVEETNAEVYYTLTDDNGLHRYNANYSGMTFNHSFIPVFAQMFETNTYTDENVTADGWRCVHDMRHQLSDMF